MNQGELPKYTRSYKWENGRWRGDLLGLDWPVDPNINTKLPERPPVFYNDTIRFKWGSEILKGVVISIGYFHDKGIFYHVNLTEKSRGHARFVPEEDRMIDG